MNATTTTTTIAMDATATIALHTHAPLTTSLVATIDAVAAVVAITLNSALSVLCIAIVSATD